MKIVAAPNAFKGCLLASAAAGVGAAAQASGMPCIAIAGSVGERLEGLHRTDIDAVFSLCPGPMPLETAMTNATKLFARAAEQVVRAYMAGRSPAT